MKIEKGCLGEEHVILRRQIGEERIRSDNQLNISIAYQLEIVLAVKQNMPACQRLIAQKCTQKLIQKCCVRTEQCIDAELFKLYVDVFDPSALRSRGNLF